MKKFVMVVWIITLFVCGGCSSKHYYSFKPEQPVSIMASEKIVGFPLLHTGIENQGECVLESEKEIDEELMDIWEDQYIPISISREKYSDVLEPVLFSLSNDPEYHFNVIPSLTFKIHDDVCKQLMEETGCRYAVVPQIISKDSTTQTIINVGWFVPAGPIVVYGSFPLTVGLNADALPVFTLTLIDLTTREIIAQEVLASKTNLNKDSIEYPTTLIDKIDAACK